MLLKHRWGRAALARAAILLGFASACVPSDEGPPRRDCRVILWAQPEHEGSTLHVLGSWDDYAEPGLAMQAGEGPWQALALDLPAGEYGYLIGEDGVARLDPLQALTRFRPSDRREVSRVAIDDCELPALVIDAVEHHADTIAVEATFLASRSGEALDPATIVGDGLEVRASSSEAGTITLATEGLPRGRHTFAIAAADEQGRRAQAKVSVFVDPIAARWSDAIVYQVVTDRFRGPGGAWLDPPATPGARAGGTFDGVTAALDEGWFDELGVSALWISPVYRNPDEAREGNEGHLYAGYHGYWPAAPHEVEPKFGGEPALRELIDHAHARGIAVILDVVPNHVYESHPIASEHGDWFNPSGCVCGSPSCPWDEYAEVCWFTPYLPDLRLEHADAMNFAVADVAWWVDGFDVDGVRVDAVPMMPRAASRWIVDAIDRLATPADRLVLGEVFTGAGSAGVSRLRWYVGPQGLDGVFDFPLMWALRDVLARESASFVEFDALLDEIDEELAGSGAVLGRMLGNHDTPRFVSAAVGDDQVDAWDPGASQPESGEPIERAALALTLQLSLPGMPVIYQGDELGLAGAGDPDNRRVMPDPATLSSERQALLAHARKLARARRCSPALRSDLRETLHVDDESLAFMRRSSEGREALVLVSRAATARTIELASVPAGRWRDVSSGATFDLTDDGGIELGPRTSLVLLPELDPCAAD
ncbi:alpha-amylase family glycosyl hydrolase [Nannocystaceae bacterium ST9]